MHASAVSRFRLGCTLFVALSLMAGNRVSATLYVKDPVPTNGVSPYAVGVSLSGVNPTNATIVGTTGAWGTGTGVFVADTMALSYPATTVLTATGGSLALKNAATSVTMAEGRVLSRPIVTLPTSGNLYFSALLRAEDQASTYLANGQSHGIGIGTNGVSGTVTATIPNDGVYFGFSKTAGIVALSLNVKGANYPLVSNPASNTTYFCVARIGIVDGNDVVSAVVNPTTAESYTLSVETNLLPTGSTFTRLRLAGAYATGGKRVLFDEARVGDSWTDVAQMADSSYPVFDNAPTVTVDGSGQFVFSATLNEGSASTAVIAAYGTTQGSASAGSWGLTKLVTDTPTLDVPVTTTLGNLATNTSYYYGVLGTNASYAVLKLGSTLMAGEVWLTAGTNAQESGFVPGSIVVRRPSSATQTPLTVNYTVSGTAVEGANYVAGSLPGTVTIPSGQDSASLAIRPLFDATRSYDTSVTLTVGAGAYYVGAASQATVLIENVNTPADKNVWVATAAGNASTAANWSQGRVPNAMDQVLVSSYSNAEMTWDAGVNGLGDTVASWTQTTGYTNTVTFPIVYTNIAGNAFTNFTVTGDVDLQGGTWTHTTHGTLTTQRYRLRVAVGGDFALGAGAKVNVYGKGRWTSGAACGAYGGNALSAGGVLYGASGDLMFPTAAGMGCQSGTDSNDKRASGGGAVWLTVGGTATLDGAVSADGVVSFAAGGSGGSVLIEAVDIGGGGSLSARGNTGTKSDGCGSSSSGGRVALLAADQMTFPVANVVIRGTRDAWNGRGAAGTLYVRSASQPGYILVKNYSNINNAATTPIPAATDSGDWAAVARCTLEAATVAHVVLGRDLRLARAVVDTTSDIDLKGFTITLNSLSISGVEVSPGVYAAADFGTEIGDSSAGVTGRVVVVPTGTVVLVR